MLTESPFVSKGDILLAYDPSGKASDAAFKRLRRDGVVAPGVRINVRRGRGLGGSMTAYSAFSRDAVVAFRKGRPDIVARLVRAAEEIESAPEAAEFARRASTMTDLRRLDVGEVIKALVADSAITDLLAHAVELRAGLEADTTALGLQVVYGCVTAIGEDTGEVTDDAGLLWRLPAAPLRERDLASAGTPVAVRVEDLGFGGQFTLVESACRYAETITHVGSDRFEDLRPPYPDDLDERLNRVLADARPLALTGPALPTAAR